MGFQGPFSASPAPNFATRGCDGGRGGGLLWDSALALFSITRKKRVLLVPWKPLPHPTKVLGQRQPLKARGFLLPLDPGELANLPRALNEHIHQLSPLRRTPG